MPSSSAPFAAIPLAPIFVPRVWGSHDLGPWFPAAQAEPIGEAWLTATECLVESGPHQGQSFGDLLPAFPQQLARGPQGEFPLLIKVLFPREKLSVQVHPDDARAQALGMPNGKNECWYILSAEPGATVAVGLRQPMSNDALRAAIEQGTLEQHLNHIPVKAGDMVFVDAGTVHAIGPGVIVLETQQYSDTTYRLFDYGRPRELHIEAGLASTKPQTRAGLVPPKPMEGFTRLVDEQYFSVDRFTLAPNSNTPLETAGKLQIVVALGEGLALNSPSASPLPLHPGHAIILPAGSTNWSASASNAAELIRILRP
jgi:mannose-6-phosphate isomerase